MIQKQGEGEDPKRKGVENGPTRQQEGEAEVGRWSRKEDTSRSRRQVLEATIRPASPTLHCGATEWGMLADLDKRKLEQRTDLVVRLQ